MTDEFPPMIATDAVVRDSQALIQRYRLLRRLIDKNGIRKDLRGAEPEPDLVAEMERQLVPGVDAPLLGSTAAWPIPRGVRLEALYASRWLKDSPALMGCYQVPRTAEEFAKLFQDRTGIAPDSDAMQSNFRITPRKLGVVFERICGSAEAPSVNGLMLLSRHFDIVSIKDWTLFERAHGTRFDRPMIQGFMLLVD